MALMVFNRQVIRSMSAYACKYEKVNILVYAGMKKLYICFIAVIMKTYSLMTNNRATEDLHP